MTEDFDISVNLTSECLKENPLYNNAARCTQNRYTVRHFQQYTSSLSTISSPRSRMLFIRPTQAS